MGRYIIGIDQSTQGTKALLVDEGGHLIHRADRPHRQIVNEAGWVSHDPAEIAANVLAVARAVVEETGVDPADIAGIGISNQRETTVAWKRTTGEPLCDAVVWQCARARELCDELAAREGVAELVRDTTGLVLSPYYPAGKMAWILANVPAAAEAAAAGELCLGTIDAWVVWTLTGGAEFRCDWSNASRTQLFDLRRGCWSEPVCEAFGVDVACLPQVTDSDGLFGMTDLGGFLPAPVPIHGVLGDSHAALFAQSYAGAVKTWLRDDLELINNPEEVTDLCYAANPASRVYFVPAFTGLGAPHWASDAEGCVFGMTRTTGRAEFVKAADESIAYQIFDVIDAMVEDSGAALAELRVDGGPTRDAYLMQFESDLVGSPIRIASNDEMSGLGAAWACGIALDMYTRDVVDVYGARGIVEPSMPADERAKKITGWRHAVAATISYTA